MRRGAGNRQALSDELDEVTDSVRDRFVVEVVCRIVQLSGRFTVTNIGKATRCDVEKPRKILRGRKEIALGVDVLSSQDSDGCRRRGSGSLLVVDERHELPRIDNFDLTIVSFSRTLGDAAHLRLD